MTTENACYETLGYTNYDEKKEVKEKKTVVRRVDIAEYISCKGLSGARFVFLIGENLPNKTHPSQGYLWQ